MAPIVKFEISPVDSRKSHMQEHTEWWSAFKNSKIIVKRTTNNSADFTMNGGKLEEETSFKYLGAILSKDGISTAEVLL
ncbi:hypothetical protein DPMN_168690 [Dreissena polymorpha]|uniref:Uncharacterized protein n=1 Tax=Dreissena polymorpha TaxID=45954 RepID=A0A9D4IZV7_DREPO|nr:hypothetical protein DPMN_168690 [Dreissena polymorpha]